MRLEHIEGFTVVGLRVRTINSDEFNPATAKLPQLWGRFFSERIADGVPNRLNKNAIFGVYSEYASDDTDFYTVTAGVKVDSKELLPELKDVNVETGEYLVFEGQGEMPQAVIQTWKTVWGYFSHNPEYKRRYRTDFELYQGSDRIAIYIGVLSS